MNNNNNDNAILAIILSLVVIIGYQYFFVRPQQEYYRQHAAEIAAQNPAQKPGQNSAQNPAAGSASTAQGTPAPDIKAATATTLRNRADVVKDTPRINIVTPELTGSVNLKGALIDDLSLVRYRESVDPASPKVTLLSPAGSAAPHNAYYAEFGWSAATPSVPMPTAETQWKADGGQLSPGHSLKLTWDNGAGLFFERLIAVDDHYMFTVTDRISNKGAAPVALHPFGHVTRQGNPVLRTSVVHEGGLGVLGGSLDECNYNDMTGKTGVIAQFFSWMFGNSCRMTTESTGGWMGFTSNYWLVSAIPPQDQKIAAKFTADGANATDPNQGLFQASFDGSEITIAPGANTEYTAHMFAGVKQKQLLDAYEDKLNIPLFNRAIDFGIFYLLTMPFLYLLDLLTRQLGSFGLAILVFTVMLKGVTLPLSLKAYHAMSKMKALQPEMKRVQERYADDKTRQSQEMMALYARAKVSPFSGCMPTLIQIPIFFALYKVLYIDIALRQAPFYGWIKDMSVPDPSSVFTLFGTIPWDPPSMLHIGAWPVIMGASMFLQQKLSPQPPDPAQARMFTIMPIIFTYMFAQFPAGLVIYWTWSNLLGIAQQWYIMWHDAKLKARAA
jgi:YidC/Oxa1 family membrane protein insertase